MVGWGSAPMVSSGGVGGAAARPMWVISAWADCRNPRAGRLGLGLDLERLRGGALDLGASFGLLCVQAWQEARQAYRAIRGISPSVARGTQGPPQRGHVCARRSGRFGTSACGVCAGTKSPSGLRCVTGVANLLQGGVCGTINKRSPIVDECLTCATKLHMDRGSLAQGPVPR